MINIFTIVKNGEPYIREHVDRFNQLKSDWRWTIVEGQAASVKCTKWTTPQEPGLSTDGTSEYLDILSNHPNITVIKRPFWDGGKVQMCNAALKTFDKAGILLQVDSDELWMAEQLENMVAAFKENPAVVQMQFFCNYFVGKDIVTSSYNCYGNHTDKGEWTRAWRFHPSMFFVTHEPPVLTALKGKTMTPQECLKYGLAFNHYAYANEGQVAFKEKFYGYDGAVEGWKRLQANKKWPVRLADYFPWVKDETMVKKLTL